MRAFINDADALERRKISCHPVPARWPAFSGRDELRWKRYRFEQATMSRVPRGPGLFCFFVGYPPDGLPPVGYPLYFGKTETTLRRRFAEYLLEQSGDASRPRARDFLEIFQGELYFMCTVFNGTPAQMATTGREIHAALMPAFSDSEYEAEATVGRGAWNHG